MIETKLNVDTGQYDYVVNCQCGNTINCRLSVERRNVDDKPTTKLEHTVVFCSKCGFTQIVLFTELRLERYKPIQGRTDPPVLKQVTLDENEKALLRSVE